MMIHSTKFLTFSFLVVGLIFPLHLIAESKNAPLDEVFCSSEARLKEGVHELHTDKMGNVNFPISEIEKLICNGHEIELLSNKVSGGFVRTRKYGKIKISPTLELTPKQIRALKALKVKHAD